ncbi:carboxypeptidase-like regulatory domain-containing protein [Bacteroides caecigallinarum]|uniref:carboxypeptidase-like regulatory domain-containing protein n=1 Tax=Bacteroides caecigallinarum TaxID=1411144 RepID=UPI001F28BC1A|nr:carboxypeptidase-like regulatory domain-containing protein [Bacteroides caecigallinarum]
MVMVRIILLCFSLAVSLCLSAQSSAVISGKVVDTSENGMYGVNIVAYNESGRQLCYAISDAEGYFTLKSVGGIAYIRFSFLGYETQTVKYNPAVNKVVVRMKETSFQLREVSVKAERISERGDTLTYSVAGFKQIQDRSIADVIRKMPGLEVKPNGSISYQGKSINHFYIEGLDLMGSQYAQASNNISADKVESVQVLENHQAVKSLRDIEFSDKAALNIVLKDDAKSVWTGLADIGLGWAEKSDGFLYENRLMGMNFKKNFQTLLLYKNTNTGTNIADEILSLSDLLEYRGEANIISLLDLGGPAFDAERYTFNKSHLLSGNWLWRTGKDSDLRIQASGLFDSEEQQRKSSTTYLDLDGSPVITEDWNVESRRKEAKGEITYTLNKERTYLKSISKVYYDWNVSQGNILYNDRLTALSVKPYKRMVSEDLLLSHTTAGGNVIQFNSSTGYTRLPGQLLTINGISQLLDMDLFSSKNHVQYKKKFGALFFDNMIGFDSRYQKINSTDWKLQQLYWSPSVSLKHKGHEITAKAKVSYVNQLLDNSGNGTADKLRSSDFWIEPNLNWRWEMSPTSKLILDYRLAADPYDAKKLVTEPLFTSYAQCTVGIGEPETQFAHSLSASFTYRNPLYGLFAYLRPVYIHNKGNILYSGELDSGVYNMVATSGRYSTDSYIVDGRIAKNFFWANTTLGIGGGVNSSESQILVSGVLAKNRMNVYNASLDYSLKPVKGISIQGESKMMICNRQEKTAPYNESAVIDWSHSLGVNFNPAGGWIFSLNNEIYHSNEKSFGVNSFCDISVGYKSKKWELSLVADNIIGNSVYEQVNVSSITRFYSMTRLRPREYLMKLSVDL